MRTHAFFEAFSFFSSFPWNSLGLREIISSRRQVVLTKVPHAFLVCVIKEKVALLHSPVDLEAETQTCILHQVRQDVLSYSLAGRKNMSACECRYNRVCLCWAALPQACRCDLNLQVCLQRHPTVFLLHCTSSLLLSRLDIETSSIFICQNYQMSRHCCGHAVAQQALAKTGLQQRRGTLETRRHETWLKQWMLVQSVNVMQVLTTARWTRRQGPTSLTYNLWTPHNKSNMTLLHSKHLKINENRLSCTWR